MLYSNYIDINDISSIIENMDPIDQRTYINLYKNYNLLHKNYDFDSIINIKDNIDIKEKLNNLEDKVYTVNSKILSEKERIVLELKNIERFLTKNTKIKNDELPIELLEKTFNELEELNRILEQIGTDDPKMINYFKKRISILQASIGINIKFFVPALETFEEKVNILISDDRKKGSKDEKIKIGKR